MVKQAGGSASVLQSVDAAAQILLAGTQQPSHSQTLWRGWEAENQCQKRVLGTAAPSWGPSSAIPLVQRPALRALLLS